MPRIMENYLPKFMEKYLPVTHEKDYGFIVKSFIDNHEYYTGLCR